MKLKVTKTESVYPYSTNRSRTFDHHDLDPRTRGSDEDPRVETKGRVVSDGGTVVDRVAYVVYGRSRR